MKAEVLQLIQDLSGGLADPATSEAYYRDVVLDLGAKELLVSTSLIQHGTRLSTFESPPSALSLLGVFYNDRTLTEETQRSLEALKVHWRDRSGDPVAFVRDTEGDRRFRLVPEPAGPSSTFAFPRGAPFGVDYPADGIGVVYTETREDVPVWLELPVALLVLAREMTRESSHRDPDFAAACATIGALVLEFVA